MADGNGTGQFIGGLVLGGAIEAVADVFFTPRSGRKTRQMLMESAQSLPEDLGQWTRRTQKIPQRSIDEALQKLQETIRARQKANRQLCQENDREEYNA